MKHKTITVMLLVIFMLSWAAIGAAQDKTARVANLPVFASPFGLLSVEVPAAALPIGTLVRAPPSDLSPVVLPAVELPVVLPAITLPTPGLPRITTQSN